MRPGIVHLKSRKILEIEIWMSDKNGFSKVGTNEGGSASDEI